MPVRRRRPDALAYLPLLLATLVVLVAVLKPDVRWIPNSHVLRAARLVESVR